MSVTIKTWRDPYDAGFSLTRPKEIVLNEGLTVLVGCNGAGKTTLLRNIKAECKNQDIPCHCFDNLSDGGNRALDSILSGFNDMPGDDMSLAVNMFLASEGETIRLHVARQSRLYQEFFKTGYFKDRAYSLHSIFRDDMPEKVADKRRFLLFDATDSGVSVDAICEIKKLFTTIMADAKELGIELYIVISANEYELCRHENCFDVNVGKYCVFKNYESYRRFILKSREHKEHRIEKQIVWQKKQNEKAIAHYNQLKTKNEALIQEIKDKAAQEGRDITHNEQWRIGSLAKEVQVQLRKLNRTSKI